MPLSEHEQKMLDEMERQLFADDPRLARAFAPKTTPRRSARRIVIGLGVVVVGLGVLVLAVSLPAVWLGVIAFLAMLAGAVFAITAPGGSSQDEDSNGDGDGGGGAGPSAPGNDDGGTLMSRLEARWDKRTGDDPRR